MITNWDAFVETSIVKNAHKQSFFIVGKRKKPPCGGHNPFPNLFLRLGFGKTFVEFVDASVSGSGTLLASVERMAIRASFDFDFLQGRTSFEGVPTANAGNGAFVVLGVDVFFHFFTPFA